MNPNPIQEAEDDKEEAQRSLRIALVMRDYSIGKGGAERYFVNLSRALANMGHEVHVFAAEFTGPETERIYFHPVPMVTKPAFLRLASFFLNARRMIRQLRNELDMVQSLTMVYPCDVFRLGGEVQREWLKIRCPSLGFRILKVIVNPVHILNHYFEKNIIKTENTGQIITISALEKQVLLKYYKYPSDRITVIYNGVDHHQFHPGVREFRGPVRKELGIEDMETVGLFSANNFQRKGLDAVIEALSRITRQDRPGVLVIGRGKTFAYERQAKALGVKDSIRFLGSVSEPERFYGASDFFVLPSRYDSFGNVHLEALACGLPVITTRMAGGSEVVRDGETGFVIGNTSRVRELADAILRLRDPELRSRMSRLAPETVRSFTPERNAMETLQVYERLLKSRVERENSSVE